MPIGLGSLPLGAGPVSFAPVGSPTAQVAPQSPLAVFINPATRDAVLLSDGTYAGCHPVDQRVALACMIAKKTLGSNPNLGQTFTAIQYAGPQLVTRVRYAFRLALKPMIDANDIAVAGLIAGQRLGIDVQAIGYGWVANVLYVNLRSTARDRVGQLQIAS